jgi:hypothetical protein
MRDKITYGPILLVDVINEFLVHEDIDHLAGTAPMRRRVESKHAVSLVNKRANVTIEIDDA